MNTKRLFSIALLSTTFGSAVAQAEIKAAQVAAPGAAVATASVAVAVAAPWVARHGLTSAEYQAAFDEYTKAGYRLTNVSGYMDGGKERFAAVWEKASGPLWVARHGLTGAQYQAAFDEYTKQGYRLRSISAWAVGSEPRFAVVFDKSTVAGGWLARHGLTAAQYQTAFDDYAKQGFRLTKVVGYVVGGTEYFAGIWEKNAGSTWLGKHNLTGAQFQTQFDTLGAQGYVLTDVSGYNKGGTDLFTGIWVKTASPLRYVRHGIAGSNYQNVFDNAYYQGYKLIGLQAFASGNGAKFNGIWTNTNISGADIGKFDKAAADYMNAQNVNGLSLAVTKNGKLVFAKAYGSTNIGNGTELSPNHSMRVWSISKSVTSAGMMTLLKDHPDLLDKKVFGPGSVLGSKYATPANRLGLNKFNVRQLMNMTSGLRSCNGETPFQTAGGTVAQGMSTLMNAADLITQDPDKGYIYSNTNYFFLGRVIEEVSGQGYEAYIRANVLEPAGISQNNMYVGRADGTAKAQEASNSPHEKVNMQMFGPFGGWLARPIDLVKLLRVVDGNASPTDIVPATTHTKMTTASSWNMGYALGWGVENTTQQNHNGCFSGGRSFFVELKNGYSYAVVINKTPTDDGCFWKAKAAFDPVIPAISKYPSYDLF